MDLIVPSTTRNAMLTQSMWTQLMSMQSMSMRSVLVFGLAVVPACVSAGVGTTSAPSGSVVVESEPPAPRAEPVPSRRGYVFIAGRWVWQHGQWTWIAGTWERERAGYAWNPGRWQRRGHGWLWMEGSWVDSTATSPVPTGEPAPPPAATPPPPPVGPAPDPSAVTMLALGEGYTCSLSVAGQVRCWGYNHHGALGVGSRAQSGDGIVTGIDGDVRSIAAGGYQTCALTATGHAWCWGSNIEGQIGNGSVA